MGNLIGAGMRQTFTDEQLIRWGWRVPFWAGVLVSFSGVYLKYAENDSCDKHHPVKEAPSSSSTNPIRTAFDKNHRGYLLSIALATVLWSSTFYILFIWMPIFMTDIRDPPLSRPFELTSLVLLITNVLFFPFAGALSDLLGRRRLMIFSGVA